MSFSKPPIVVSSAALLAALSVVPTQGWARDGRTGGGVVYQMAPMSTDESQDIIFVMPPMKPVPGMAVAKKPAPKPAEPQAPAIAAKPTAQPEQAAPAQPAPAPVAEAPKPAEPAQPAEASQSAAAPQPAEAPQPVAEATNPAPTEQLPVAEAPAQQPPVAEAPAAPAPSEQAAQPAVPPAEAVADEGPQPAETPVATDAPAEPVEQPAAPQATQIVEPAPIGPPIMTLNPPRKALDALKAPTAALEADMMRPQGDFVARGLVPKLESLAKNDAPEQAPAVAVADASANPAPAEMAPVPADPTAAAEADAETRISTLLSEGLVGPVEIRIADRATMWLPAGHAFIPPEAAKTLAREAGLEWRPGIQGLVVPAGGKLQWLAPVELLDDGYIKSDDAASLQPEKLLAAFEAGLPEMNAQRARIDQPPVSLGGWLTPPELTAKHRLSACVNIATQNDQNGLDRFFNCEAWALGRQGAIKVALADGGEEAARLKGEAATLADTIVFDRGQTYEDFNAATDKVAPYAAADLLTRDVTLQTAAPVAAAPEEAAPADLLSRLLFPALLGAAALGAYVFIKRRKGGGDDAPLAEETPPVAAPAPEAAPAAGGAPPSLFARLLPTLHARFAKWSAPADEEAAPPAYDAAPAPAPAAPVAQAEKSAVDALKDKLASLRAAVMKDAPAVVKAATPAAPAPVETVVPDGSEEPASALKKLASRMRRSGDREPTPEVNVSRALRPTRTLPGAAPALAAKFPEPEMAKPIAVEPALSPAAIVAEAPKIEELKLVEPGEVELMPQPAPKVAEAKPAPAPEPAPPAPSVFDEDDFDLVEPGDSEAASAAFNAGRARREANG